MNATKQLDQQTAWTSRAVLLCAMGFIWTSCGTDSNSSELLPDGGLAAAGNDAGNNNPANKDAGQGGGGTGTYPADFLDLTNWKLTLPVDTAHAGSPDEITQTELATFQLDPYFVLTPAKDGVVFQANAGGATTSGSGYPRSELREMTNNGQDEASWSSTSGTHIMVVNEAITHLPVAKPQVVAAQIHDSSDDVIMIRLEGANLFVESNGNNIGTLDSAYVLGTPYTVRIEASGGHIKVSYNGTQKLDTARSGSGWYFKAGCYTQSNTSKGDSASAYGEVIIYSLNVTHTSANPDAGTADAGSGVHDAGTVDAGSAHDAGTPDAGSGALDAGSAPDAGQGGGSLTYPANLLNLTNWKLTLPIDTAHSGSPDEITQTELATFQIDPYFHLTPAKDGVVFQANCGGATTSGSGYPRSELREMANSGQTNASWSSTSGTHVMVVHEAITHLPVVKPQVVAAQIHDASDDVIMIRLEGSNLFVESNGNDMGTLDSAYVLGTAYTVRIEASGGHIKVSYNGTQKVDITRSGSGMYFKAGCYTQSNVSKGDSASAYGEVVIYSVDVTHT